MTDKLIMTTAQREQVLQAIRMPHGFTAEVVELLQALPMVDSQSPRGVPNLEDFAKQLCTEHGTLDIYETVYRDQGNSYTPYSGQPAWSTYVLDAEYALRAYEKCSKLYTSPQALTPITADDVTDEMIHNWHANTFGAQAMGGVADRDMIVAAYNAVIQQRSEA